MQDGYDVEEEFASIDQDAQDSVTVAKWVALTALVIGLFAWVFA